MIVSKVPLRITFNGGGTDLPHFFNQYPGICLTASIDRFVYLTVSESFDGRYRVAYSTVEHVDNIEAINHPLVRNTLKYLEWRGPGLEITSVAEVPSSGTGLGSSSAFTVALVRAICYLQNRILTAAEYAHMATAIEINLTGDPIGWQDQYAVADGNLIEQKFSRHGVEIENIFKSHKETNDWFKEVNKYAMFFHLDKARKTNEILTRQHDRLREDEKYIDLTKSLVELATITKQSISSFDFKELGKNLSEGWKVKMMLNGDSQDLVISELFKTVALSRAYGAKLLGAGGGGFLFLLAEPSSHSFIREDFKFLKMHNFKIGANAPSTSDLGASYAR